VRKSGLGQLWMKSHYSAITRFSATKAPNPLSLRSRAQPCAANFWLPRQRADQNPRFKHVVSGDAVVQIHEAEGDVLFCSQCSRRLAAASASTKGPHPCRPQTGDPFLITLRRFIQISHGRQMQRNLGSKQVGLILPQRWPARASLIRPTQMALE
jgi:hypothetical protein